MRNNFFNADTDNESLLMQRREFLKFGFAGIVGGVLPLISTKEALASSNWKVSFRHGHTGESFSGVYRVGDKYLPEAFERLNYVLRDFRTKEVFPMDPHILDIMAIIQQRTGRATPLQVLSGYRSPKTNAMLRVNTSGVAQNSYHMYGQAIDIRMPGYRSSKLRDIARSLKAGGVGLYSRSNFVHIDTGKVRSWAS